MTVAHDARFAPMVEILIADHAQWKLYIAFAF